MKERAFRFTRLEVDEPEVFANNLNTIWSDDIKNNLFNIIFVIDEFKSGQAGAAAEKISLVGGSAWRLPADKDVDPNTLILKPPQGKNDADSIHSLVESYCHLPDTTINASAKSYHGKQCEFKTFEVLKDPSSAGSDSTLNFHPGPIDTPVICAPDIKPANTIPLMNLKIRFGFNPNCSAIQNGYLEGCITVEDANRICMCPLSGTCEYKPSGDTYSGDNLTKYCRTYCGDSKSLGNKWISFGNLAKLVRLKPTCMTTTGDSGYRIQGYFDAVMLAEEKFNPVKSNDCSAKEQ